MTLSHSTRTWCNPILVSFAKTSIFKYKHSNVDWIQVLTSPWNSKCLITTIPGKSNRRECIWHMAISVEGLWSSTWLQHHEHSAHCEGLCGFAQFLSTHRFCKSMEQQMHSLKLHWQHQHKWRHNSRGVEANCAWRQQPSWSKAGRARKLSLWKGKIWQHSSKHPKALYHKSKC